MFQIKTIPVLMRMVSKIDIRPAVDALRNADIFEATDGKKAALKQLTSDKVIELGVDVITAITPQLDKISDDLVELVAAYKGVSIEEAGELDVLEVASEIVHDKGIRTFFSKALRNKVERTS